MRLMQDSEVDMEKEDTTTRAVELEEHMKIQHTVTRLALQEPRHTGRRNNHAQCAHLLDPAHQMLDVLRRDMMTGEDTLESAHRDQAGRDLVSSTLGSVSPTHCSNWNISGWSAPSR